MAKIHELTIKNFRCIKTFSQKFNKDFICLIGRGDTGKTTILDAIACVLSPNRKMSFYDNDFYNGEVIEPIEIEVTITDLPQKILIEDKYGLLIRGIDADGNIQDDIEENHIKALTINLKIEKDLEPQWTVVNNRQDPKRISAYDREKFNMFMIADYIDRHFSWNKGNPLYALLSTTQNHEESDNVVIEALREAKTKIDTNEFSALVGITEKVKEISSDFGVDLSGANTTIDFRDISIKDGRVCLHDGGVPFRLKGKGSKRLISIAIQCLLVQNGGVLLVDEVEQGLEPDRVKQLIRILEKKNNGQIFITTHSSEVITELDAERLSIIKSKDGDIIMSEPGANFQDVIRACPEAEYAKKVIMCEGKTELGICRALDVYRKKNGKEYMCFMDCIYSLGEGHSFTLRAKKLKELGLDICVFCDSDKDSELKPTKDEVEELGIKVFDCDNGNAIEDQVFTDLPWCGIKELLDYVIKEKGVEESRIVDSLKFHYKGTLPGDWKCSDTAEMRRAIAKSSKTQEWFKRMDAGEYFGLVILKYIDQIGDSKIISQIKNISSWIDNELC